MTSIQPRPPNDGEDYVLLQQEDNVGWIADADYRNMSNLNFTDIYSALSVLNIAGNSGKLLYNAPSTGLQWLSFSDVNIAELSSHANYAAFPSSGQSTAKIYLDQATGEFWRWSGSAYVRTDGNQPRLNEVNTFTSANTFSAGLTVSSGLTVSGTTSTGTTNTGALTASSISTSGNISATNITSTGNITANFCTVNEINCDNGGATDPSIYFNDGTYGIYGNGNTSFCHSGYLICEVGPDGLWFNSSGTGLNRGLAIESMGSGTDQFIGTATLVNGTVTIANTRVTADSHIFLTYKTLAGGGPYEALVVHAIVAGTSFTVRPTDGAVSYNDSTFYFWIIPQTL